MTSRPAAFTKLFWPFRLQKCLRSASQRVPHRVSHLTTVQAITLPLRTQSVYRKRSDRHNSWALTPSSTAPRLWRQLWTRPDIGFQWGLGRAAHTPRSPALPQLRVTAARGWQPTALCQPQDTSHLSHLHSHSSFCFHTGSLIRHQYCRREEEICEIWKWWHPQEASPLPAALQSLTG